MVLVRLVFTKGGGIKTPHQRVKNAVENAEMSGEVINPTTWAIITGHMARCLACADEFGARARKYQPPLEHAIYGGKKDK